MWAGIVLILATGFIHAIEVGEAFEEMAYKGWLFAANALGSMVAVYWIFRGKCFGWQLGFLIAAGSIIGYVLSRTVGLPGLAPEPDEWLEPLGVASLAAEGLFLAVVIAGGLFKKMARHK